MDLSRRRNQDEEEAVVAEGQEQGEGGVAADREILGSKERG
jgi:hypothetical protein